LRAYVVVTLYGNQIAPAATAVLPSALQATKVASARWAIYAGLVIATLEHMARATTDNVELRLNMQYSRWKLGGAIAGYVPRRCIGVFTGLAGQSARLTCGPSTGDACNHY
jgi:hypothetical protein